MLSEKALAARREYKKQWAKKNPEKVRACQQRYWEKKGAQLAAELCETRSCENAQPDEGATPAPGGE